MDNMQSQMNAILSNPDMMEKIMQMAQSLGSGMPEPQQPQPVAPQQDAPLPLLPDIDLSMVQKLSGLVGQTGIDQNQRTLLSALRPYLSHSRVTKLEKAMRAAKLANLASSFIGTQFTLGR